MVEQTSGGRWGDDRVTSCDIAYCAQQLGGAGVLEEESGCAGLERGVDVLVEVEGGENEHLRVQWGLSDTPSCLDAVHLWHPDVHEGNVDRHSPQHVEGFDAVGRLRDNLHVILGFDEHAESRAYEGLVVDEDDADRIRHGTSSCSSVEVYRPRAV